MRPVRTICLAPSKTAPGMGDSKARLTSFQEERFKHKHGPPGGVLTPGKDKQPS